MGSTRDPGSSAMTPRQSTDEEEEKVAPPSSPPDVITESKEEPVASTGPIVAADEPQEYLTGLKLFLAMFSLTFVAFLILLDVSVVATAIPRITTQFHSLDDVGWYGSSYILAFCACQPLSGKIYGSFDMKWTFLSFFAVFELGSLLCATATSSNMLIIGRAVAGLGSSGIINGGYSIVNASAPLPRQPFLLGILMGLSQLGILSGPLIGGALTEYASWRWCFYINLPCGGAATILLLFVTLPQTTIKDAGNRTILGTLRKLDPIGFCLFAPAAIQFLLALQWGGVKYAWGSATVIGLFCGSFGTLLAFVAWEYRMGDGGMIPLSIISKRVVWSSCLNYGFLTGSMLIVTYYLPIYFQAVRNATPALSGVYLLPMIITMILSVIATGALLGRLGYYLPFAVASAAIVAIASGLMTMFSPTTAVKVWIGYQILLGVGRGMGVQVPIIAVQNNASKDEIPIVNALVVFAQNLGGAIFLSIGQLVFSSRLRHGLHAYAPGVDVDTVINAGATGLRSTTAVPEASLPGVLLAYSEAYDGAMYLSAGVAGVAFIFAFGMGWVSTKKPDATKLAPEPEP